MILKCRVLMPALDSVPWGPPLPCLVHFRLRRPSLNPTAWAVRIICTSVR